MTLTASNQSDLITGDPRREVRKTALAEIRDYIRASREQGGLITQGQAARLLEVSGGQVGVWLRRGRLTSFDVAGLKMVSAAEIMVLMKDRQAGRIPGPGRGLKAPSLSDFVSDALNGVA